MNIPSAIPNSNTTSIRQGDERRSQSQANNSYFTAPPQVSLPKGGGAIKGIGEKFAANPVTGTGSMSVPIATSLGRNGFSPQLALSYDSGAGNGVFGFGWNLSTPSITHKTDKGLPRYMDVEVSDVFMLSGAEDLVPVLIEEAGEWVSEPVSDRTMGDQVYTIKRYRPRIEGLFAQIEHWINRNDRQDTFWRSISRDNITTWYGKNADSRIADPVDPTRIFSWLICERYDDKGNAIRYSYKPEDSAGIDTAQAHERNRNPLSRSANRYLKRIHYGNRVSRLVQPDLTAMNWLFEVVFDYGEHDKSNPTPDDSEIPWAVRSDSFSSYRAGFEVRTYRLCQRVLMFHHFLEEANVGRDCLVRSTDFTYSYEENSTSAQNPIYSKLIAVTQTGYKRNPAGGYFQKSLPPLEFTYSEPQIDQTVRTVDPISLENLPYGLDGTRYQWIDLDGEGTSGILTEQGNAWFYKRNLSPINIVQSNDTKHIEARFAPVERIASRSAIALADGLNSSTKSISQLRTRVGLTKFLKWVELGPNPPRPDGENDFTLENIFLSRISQERTQKVLNNTPGIFSIAPPWHLSRLDQMWLNGLYFAPLSLDTLSSGDSQNGLAIAISLTLPVGTWLPFFYNDRDRTFFVLPTLLQNNHLTPSSHGDRSYYPEIKQFIRYRENYFEQFAQNLIDKIFGDFSALTPEQRQTLEKSIYKQFPEIPPPTYTTDQVRTLMQRSWMRYFHKYLGQLSLAAFQSRQRQFHFKNFYHPFVCDFAKLVYNPLQGIPALMSREIQLKDSGFRFFKSYQPTEAVVELTSDPSPPYSPYYPEEIVDFSSDGAYAPYNWELFFHIPLLIANSLSKNQRFEEARDWYHFIFNPIGLEGTTEGGSPMSKYWITKPFFETTQEDYIQQRIDNILRMLAGDTSDSDMATQTELRTQVVDWRTNPFEPHRIANYRTVAYQKTIVMKYLDNLIAWGDNLFRQDSMESITEATQLYILAAEILGPRPQKIPLPAKPPIETFNELESDLDAFSNALIEVENLIPPLPTTEPDGADPAPFPLLYFCLPQNDKMLGYWDTVSDRLYKIRNCMNIEGVERQLALFEPPIDPGALIKATASGVDIGSVFADLNAPLPLYRFNVLLQTANTVCNDVKSLGSALLSALEKRDAEALSLLRQGQEIRLLEAVKTIREQQIDEAEENAKSLCRSRKLVEERKDYYKSIEEFSDLENASMITHGIGILSEGIATIFNATAGTSHWLPEVNLGVSGLGSPVVTAKFGGRNVGDSSFNWATFFNGLGSIAHATANLMATKASYERRWEEWKLQERLAEKELEQIDKQIAAADIRKAIADKELENHMTQIENAKATDEFMRSKYTNEELYQWQVGQLSSVYFQSYQLAYDIAKRTERCFRFEVGVQDSSYIQFGYWDSLKKGLLAGEKLQYDLRRLENAYLEQHRREFELTKHISLALLDPLALIQLRETGRCFINLPEEIFDLDYPGHYFRRIKSVSITLPCVVGPYTTVSCTLRLLKNSIRMNTASGDNGYPRNMDDQGMPVTDDRFIENNIPVKAIAASNAQNDSGVFELNFRDERYLPFEGAGVISQWSLELFNDDSEDFGKALRQFDYNTITDVILHIRYMAREDAEPFKSSAIAHLREYFSQDGATPSLRMFNLRQEFPTQWHRFINPTNPVDGNIFELELITNLFPIRDQDKILKVNAIWLLARCTNSGDYTATLTHSAGTNSMTLTTNNQYGGLHVGQPNALEIEIAPATEPPITWQLRMTRPGGELLQPDEVEDMLFILGYKSIPLG
ncbi:MAG: hypothetical protein Kow00121_14770 [Elainellaceae cyanobacterium]